MGRRKPVKFFLRFLLLTVLTFVVLILAFVLIEMGGAGISLGVILVIINILLLIIFFFMSVGGLIKHIFDREKKHFDFMYLVNLLFTIFINGIFLTFFFFIAMGALIILLPFLET